MWSSAAARSPQSWGSLTTIVIAWLAVCLAALFDLWRQIRALASIARWRVARWVALRLVPMLLLIAVPWTVAHFSDRVFSVQALGAGHDRYPGGLGGGGAGRSGGSGGVAAPGVGS